MKTTLVLLSAALLLSPVAAMAQTATGTGTANSSSNSGAVAISGGGQGGQGGQGGSGGTGIGKGGTGIATGGNSSIVFNTPGTTVNTSNNNSRIRQSGSLKTTPNAIAPGLGSSGIETCYGPGVTAGVSVTGFGISGGAGQFDANCNARLAARTMWAFGEKRIALRIMAQDPIVMQAMQAEGMITPDRPVAYGARPVAMGNAPREIVVETGEPGTPSRRGMYASCTKWSGGAVGVGRCVY